MIIDYCTQILRQTENGQANYPDLQLKARDPVTELVYKLLQDKAALRQLKREALDACTVRRKGDKLEIIAADDDKLDALLSQAGETAVNVEAMKEAVARLENLFEELNIKEPVLLSIEALIKNRETGIERAKSEIVACAQRVAHANRVSLSPEEVLKDPRYTKVRAEQMARIEALRAELSPLKAGMEKAEDIINKFDLEKIDITGGHYLLPKEGYVAA